MEKRQVAVLALAGLGGVFAALNLDEVEVNWILGTWETPLIIVIAISMLIGAGLGAGAANLLGAAFGREPHIVVVVVLAVIGALAALRLQRYVIVVATAFGGAQTVVVGAAALMGNRVAASTAARAIYTVYPLNPMPDTVLDAMAAIVLGIAGIAVQLMVTAKGRK